MFKLINYLRKFEGTVVLNINGNLFKKDFTEVMYKYD